MPFVNTALTALVTNNGFSMWLYRTADTRATALAAGYFSSASARLMAGDVIFLQASDALTLTTVRSGTTVAGGLVVDTFAAPFRVNRTAAQRFSIRQAVTAVAMTVLLLPLAGGIVAGATLQAQAAVAGPVAQVSFSISDAGGATVSGPQSAIVTAGNATATLTVPAQGSGYRLGVEAVGFPGVVDTSAAFAVSAPYALLVESADALVAEDGGRLLI